MCSGATLKAQGHGRTPGGAVVLNEAIEDNGRFPELRASKISEIQVALARASRKTLFYNCKTLFLFDIYIHRVRFDEIERYTTYETTSLFCSGMPTASVRNATSQYQYQESLFCPHR